MKLRRMPSTQALGQTTLQRQQGSLWVDLLPGSDEAAALSWLSALPTLRPEGADPLLPFQPLSFRDGMLFEQHWIQSSRGYARRFMPA
ncbi:MAG TPA: hypothetical protein VFH49_03410, partial [Aquabacterium sp.]|nr:hypothetical protein [Aquabacterium sp.]